MSRAKDIARAIAGNIIRHEHGDEERPHMRSYVCRSYVCARCFCPGDLIKVGPYRVHKDGECLPVDMAKKQEVLTAHGVKDWMNWKPTFTLERKKI